jgi:hypothetical protein
MIFLGLNQTGSFMIQYNHGYETNPMAQMMYQTINNSFSEVSMIIHYYRTSSGFEPTFYDIERYTLIYTVTTSKVSEEYSISYNKDILSSNMVSSTNRLASLDISTNRCEDRYVWREFCADNPCWECTVARPEACCGYATSYTQCQLAIDNRPHLSNCQRVN